MAVILNWSLLDPQQPLPMFRMDPYNEVMPPKWACRSLTTPVNVSTMEWPGRNHWVSSSIYAGPLQSSSLRVCTLSVILEAGLQSDISGIKIVIVNPHAGRGLRGWDKMKIRECLNGYAVFPQPRNLSIQTPRSDIGPEIECGKASAVASYRSALRRCTGSIVHSNSPMSHRILQVVLSVSPANRSTGTDNGFAKDYNTHIVFQVLDVGTNPKDRNYHPIVFQKTFTIDPYNPSISIMLESSEWFVSTEWPDPDELVDVIGFSFRILPCAPPSNKPSKIMTLPPELLLKIIRETVPPLTPDGTSIHHWESGTLSFALVCKSWAFLLQVLFEKIEEGYPVRNFLAFVESLNYQPTMARHLQSFSERTLLRMLKEEYDLLPEEPIYPDVVEGCQYLLLILPTILEVDIDQRLFVCVSDYLSRLSTVQSFGLSDQPWYREGTKPTATFEEVYSTLQQGSSLKRLKISTRLKPSTVGYQDSQLDSPTFALEELLLGAGTYNKPQVLCLIASSTGTLTQLRLVWIEGLSNGDLFEILRVIAGTLQVLELTGSRFPTSDSDMYSTPKALDGTISQMPNLVRVAYADDDIATKASLLLKRPCPRHRPFIKSEWKASCCSIYIDAVTNRDVLWRPEEFHSILNQTGWSLITVMIPDNEWYPPEEIERLKGLASEKGIELRLFKARSM